MDYDHDYSIRFFFSFIQIFFFFWLIVIGVFDGFWIPSAVSERFTTNKQSTDCTVRERERESRQGTLCFYLCGLY